MLAAATILWLVPASAADLTVTSPQPNTSGLQSLTSGKKASTAGRPLFVQRAAVQQDRATGAQRDRHDSGRNYSDAWYRRQFVLLLGVGY
jgi:hypothetical protein